MSASPNLSHCRLENISNLNGTNDEKDKIAEAQIVSILKQHEAGMAVKELIREHGISEATFYNWKAKYGSMEASDVKRMQDMEEENNRLKRIVVT